MDNHNEFAHLYPVMFVPDEITQLMKDNGFEKQYSIVMSYYGMETMDENRDIDLMIMDCFNSFEYIETAYRNRIDRFIVNSPYLEQIKNCLDTKFKQFDNTGYYGEIDIKKDAISSPYKYKLPDNFKINKYHFLVLKKYMFSKKYSSFEQFKKRADDILCSEWYKMDEHGECYGGFYKYPKDTEEYKNAYVLTRSKNIQCLFDLPYSKHFILKVAKYLCSYGFESVETVYNLCEWIKQTNDYTLSLK